MEFFHQSPVKWRAEHLLTDWMEFEWQERVRERWQCWHWLPH
jgi:hypothetical protein